MRGVLIRMGVKTTPSNTRLGLSQVTKTGIWADPGRPRGMAKSSFGPLIGAPADYSAFLNNAFNNRPIKSSVAGRIFWAPGSKSTPLLPAFYPGEIP